MRLEQQLMNRYNLRYASARKLVQTGQARLGVQEQKTKGAAWETPSPDLEQVCFELAEQHAATKKSNNDDKATTNTNMEVEEPPTVSKSLSNSSSRNGSYKTTPLSVKKSNSAKSALAKVKSAVATKRITTRLSQRLKQDAATNAATTNTTPSPSSLPPQQPQRQPTRERQPSQPPRLSTGLSTITANMSLSTSRPSRPSRLKKTPSIVFSSGTFADKYKIGRELGVGTYSVVRQAIRKDNGQEFAVKVVDTAHVGTSDTADLTLEIRIMQELSHPNILALRDVYCSTSSCPGYHLVFDQMKGGELFDRIVSKQCYDENDARNIMYQLLSALSFCHDHRIAHRDLKPENLLLKDPDDDSQIVLADFGLAKKLLTPSSLFYTMCGTPGYVAPEILLVNNCRGYDTQVDLWSLGVILYILLGGYSPFDDSNEFVVKELIKKGDYAFHPEYWGHVSTDAKELIASLLRVDGRQRASAADALQSRWMNLLPRQLKQHDLEDTLPQLRQFNAKRKLRGAVHTVVSTCKFRRLIGKR